MVKKYFTIQNTAWFCISLFYSRKDWGKLIQEIRLFYEHNKLLFNYCIIYFSEYKGEHIRLALSLSADNDLDLIQENTDRHFRSYILNNPSDETKPFQYGKNLWCNYNNNSIAWNRFEFSPAKDGKDLDFLQITSSMMIDLLEGDFSLNNILSITIFLNTKILKIHSVILGEQSHIIIDNALRELTQIPAYQSFFTEYNLNKKLELYGISGEEILEIIEQYWNYYDEDYVIYKQWEEEIKTSNTITHDSFLTLNYFIWFYMDIIDSLKLMIIYSLKKWSQNKKNQK